MPEVSYVPGAMTAVVGDGCLALVDGPPDSVAVALIWQHFAQQARANAILGALLGANFAGAESFALVAQGEDDQLRLFCRGAVGATALGGAVPAWFDGAGLSTWSEHLIGTDVTRVVVGEPTADRPWCLPASAGVLLAECVIIDLTGTAAGQGGAGIFGQGSEFPDAQTLRGIRLRAQGAPFAPADESPADESAADESPADESATDESAADEFPADEFASAMPSADEPPANESAADEPRAGQLPAWEPAAEIAAPATDFPGEDSTAGEIAADPPPAVAPKEPDTITMPDPSQLSVANARQDSPDVREPDAARLAPADLSASAGPPAPSNRIGPMVSALLCPAGHANPPEARACRWCGEPLPPVPVLIPQPVLGVLRLSIGDVVTLDRDVVMGRNPSADLDGATNDERPHVVKVPSDDGDISRTHLRVTLDGWQVLVTDLNSTNGTLVALPGRQSEQVRPGEPTPIPPGTVVMLPEGISFRYELSG